MANLYRVCLVHKGLKEIVPQRAHDRANATGQWFKHLVPVMPRKGFAFKTEAAAMRAMNRQAKHLPNPDEWRGLLWMRGRENSEATTIAI